MLINVKISTIVDILTSISIAKTVHLWSYIIWMPEKYFSVDSCCLYRVLYRVNIWNLPHRWARKAQTGYAQTGQSCRCSHKQSMNVDRNSDQNRLLAPHNTSAWIFILGTCAYATSTKYTSPKSQRNSGYFFSPRVQCSHILVPNRFHKRNAQFN